MAYVVGNKNNKKTGKKTNNWAGKNSTPKVDLEAIKRRKAENDVAFSTPVNTIIESEVPTTPASAATFIPVILEAKHDVVGKTWPQWHQYLFKNKPLKTIPAERQHVFDSEAASTLYRRAGEVVRKSVDSGTWNDQPRFKEMLSDVAGKAIDCNTLNSSQLFPFLRAAVQILQEELSVDVQDMFDVMEELKESGTAISSDQTEEWIRLLMFEVGKEMLRGTQEYLYETLSARWSYLTDDQGVAPTRLDRLEFAYKFGTAKCTEENYQSQCLKDLAKCLGSVEPADWRWVEPLEQFRSRAWSLVEYEREKFAGVSDEEEVVTLAVGMSVSEEVRTLREQSGKWREKPVKPVQTTIAARPPSTPANPETFGERALRLHYAARLVLPDIAPTVEMAATSIDPLVLEACARSTDFDVLMAVLNNPSTPFTAIEVVTSNERVSTYIVKQSEGRERAAK